jgi:hypothetical protein
VIVAAVFATGVNVSAYLRVDCGINIEVPLVSTPDFVASGFIAIGVLVLICVATEPASSPMADTVTNAPPVAYNLPSVHTEIELLASELIVCGKLNETERS